MSVKKMIRDFARGQEVPLYDLVIDRPELLDEIQKEIDRLEVLILRNQDLAEATAEGSTHEVYEQMRMRWKANKRYENAVDRFYDRQWNLKILVHKINRDLGMKGNE